MAVAQAADVLPTPPLPVKKRMRFELLWENGYDVAPVIASMLEAC
jgi:hypothetical protein